MYFYCWEKINLEHLNKHKKIEIQTNFSERFIAELRNFPFIPKNNHNRLVLKMRILQ